MTGDSTNSAGMLDDICRWGPRLPTPLWGLGLQRLQQQQDSCWPSCLRHQCCCSEGRGPGMLQPRGQEGTQVTGTATGTALGPQQVLWSCQRWAGRVSEARRDCQAKCKWLSWPVASWHPVWLQVHPGCPGPGAARSRGHVQGPKTGLSVALGTGPCLETGAAQHWLRHCLG